ncbi:hypothetical protein [Nocardiopsis rhodophaea]|uniref:hypothetical protein n=1 Tax=Nocardiopsis rhodophaea TaxID=280238 RepID=UPI0031DFF98B
MSAYLRRRDEAWRDRLTEAVEQQSAPRDRMLAVFDALDAWLSGEVEGFRGCAFVNAVAESPTPDHTPHEGQASGGGAQGQHGAGPGPAEPRPRGDEWREVEPQRVVDALEEGYFFPVVMTPVAVQGRGTEGPVGHYRICRAVDGIDEGGDGGVMSGHCPSQQAESRTESADEVAPGRRPYAAGAAVALRKLRQDEAVDDIACRPAQPHELAAVAELRWRWVHEVYGTPDATLDEFVPRFVEWAREAESSHRCMVMVRDNSVIGMAWLAITQRVPHPRRSSGCRVTCSVCTSCRTSVTAAWAAS